MARDALLEEAVKDASFVRTVEVAGLAVACALFGAFSTVDVDGLGASRRAVERLLYREPAVRWFDLSTAYFFFSGTNVTRHT